MDLLRGEDPVLAQLVRDSPLAIVVSTRSEGRILDANDAFLRLFGYTRGEVIGQTSTALGMWADHEQRARLTAALETRTPLRDFQVTVKTKRGEERQVLATVSATEIDDQACLLTQLLDVSAHRQAEHQFQTLTEQLPVVTYVHALDDPLTLTYISPQVETMLGFTPEEVIAGQPSFLAARTHPEDRSTLLAAVERTRATGVPFQTEYRVQARDGRWVWIQDEAALVRDRRGRPILWQGVMIDVTAQREAEHALRRAEARYQLLVEQIPVVTYTERLGDTDSYSYVSPQIEALLGYAPSEVVDHPQFLNDRTHPDDLEAVLREGARTSATGEPFRMEYRVQARSGRWIWLRDESILARDDEGQPLHWQGVLLDITAQREAEERERRAQHRYRELFDDAPVMYVITRNEAGNPIIADCNTMFLSTLGYEREEVIGRSLAEFYTAESQEALFAGGYAAAMAGNLAATERKLVSGDGHVLDVLIVARPEFGDRETPPGTRVSFVDVSDRVAAESARLESEERLRTIVDTVPTGIVVHDAASGIVLANPAAERALDLTFDQLAGLTSLDPRWAAIHEDGSPFPGEEHPAMVSLRTGQPHDNVIMGVRRPNSAVRWLSINSRALIRDTETAPYAVVASFTDLTERFQLEEELREREERFRALVQNSYDVIVVLDADGNRTYVSPSIERVLGYTVADVLGHNPIDLAHPDDASRLQAAIEACLRGAREVPAFELRLRHRDGSWRDFEAIGTNLLDEPSVAGIVFNSREITARKAAQAALRESEERFRSAFDHAPIGIALVAPDGHFLQVNRALCELVGYAEHELVGQTFQAITHLDDLAGDLELAKRLWDGQIDMYQLEKRYIHKDGHEVWVLLTGSTVRNGGAPQYGIAQIVDITERRQLESERGEMLKTEREYSRRLRELTAMRADLTAMIAHELHAPVSALRMMTFLLRTGKLAAQDEDTMFTNIDEEIARLDRLINDVAEVTLAEREDFAADLSPVPLAMLFGDAARYAQNTLRDHPFSMAAAPDIRVRCDPGRITQVLRNLLDNAAKHTPAGTAVELRARRDGSRLRIEVADSGPGLSQEDISVIFEKFGRGRHAAARQLPGAGLGLYLSRRILMAHQSDLRVHSAPGKGTVFTFDLEIVP